MKNSNDQHLLVLFFLFVGLLVVLCGGQAQEEDTSVTVAPMEKNEQEALYSAIQGFIGKSWNGSDLYPDPCGWTPIQGVSCDFFNRFWHVTAINIGPVYDNSLRCSNDAKFTHHLFQLNHLNSLSFFNCFFFTPTQNIPFSNWEKLENSLEYLEFRSNPGLIGSIPTSIGCLKKLQSLVLLENGLTGNLPIELGSLVNLKRLVLAGNQFTGQIPASTGGLNELLILDLSRNNLSGSMPLALGGLTSLLKLDLSNNILEGELPKEIGNLKNVTLLDLRSNRFSGGGFIQAFQEMVSLKEMVLSNNPNIGGELTGIEWRNLPNLEILDLSNMGLIGTVPAESMAELGRLRFLGLNDNKLSGNLSPRLANMPNIRALYVYGNNLTGKLEFSDSFYKKLGRRFGAWNNPSLCYRAESTSKSHVVIPYGVKPCSMQQTRIHHTE